MAMAVPPSRYRRLRKASDPSTFTAASPPSKLMCFAKKHTSCEDRISSLPDEILITILDKLDTRSIVAIIILSRRWRDLPRSLTTSYNLAVNDMLPPRYHRLKRINMEAKAGYQAAKNAEKLTCMYAVMAQHDRWMAKIRPRTAILKRYERRAMRRYVKQVNSFLLAPTDVRQHRPVQKLRLQTVGRGWTHTIDKWIATAIGKWGVEDFELAVEDGYHSYDLRKLDRYQNVRLERLALYNCEPVCAWNCFVVQRLTKLELCGCLCSGLIIPILTNCRNLTDFRIRCSRSFRPAFSLDVPTSKIKNLQVDRCEFGKIYLISLACLETFACRGHTTKLYYGEVPRLRHISLDYSQTEGDEMNDDSTVDTAYPSSYPPSKFFKRIPPLLDSLVLQFKGPQMWIQPLAIPSSFGQLKKMFIANLQVNWDVHWILLLLDAAPVLESFQVHIDNSGEERSRGGVCAGLDVAAQQQHQFCRLKELAVAGFEGLGWQTGFVRLIMNSSPLLRCVHLLDGEVRYEDEQDLGVLKVVPRRREWHECERAEVLDDLTAGFSWPPQIVLE